MPNVLGYFLIHGMFAVCCIMLYLFCIIIYNILIDFLYYCILFYFSGIVLVIFWECNCAQDLKSARETSAPSSRHTASLRPQA